MLYTVNSQPFRSHSTMKTNQPTSSAAPVWRFALNLRKQYFFLRSPKQYLKHAEIPYTEKINIYGLWKYVLFCIKLQHLTGKGPKENNCWTSTTFSLVNVPWIGTKKSNLNVSHSILFSGH
jgi:hypothetical protein